MTIDNTYFELLLSKLVGDNVGENCDCPTCNDNRQAMRDCVEVLISERTAELEAKLRKLEAENAAEI